MHSAAAMALSGSVNKLGAQCTQLISFCLDRVLINWDQNWLIWVLKIRIGFFFSNDFFLIRR